MARPLFILSLIFCILSLTSASQEQNPTPYRLPHHGHRTGGDCRRRPIGYMTPSYGAVPVPITTQGQPVTTYIPTAVARHEGSGAYVTKYLTSTYVWYSTYVAGYPHGKPQYISRGDQALTLPPREPPKYAVCTTTITTTGSVRVGKKTYNVDKVPAKIEYVREVGQSFGVCKAEDYFLWSQQNTERASRLGLKKLVDIDGGRINVGPLRLGKHRGGGDKDGSYNKHSSNRLTVDYVSCRKGVCTTEVQDWSVGYRAQAKKRVIAAEFSGWCDGQKPYACELCADVRGYGRVTVTAEVYTSGPCTTSTSIMTEETVTKTITRTRAARATAQAKTSQKKIKNPTSDNAIIDHEGSKPTSEPNSPSETQSSSSASEQTSPGSTSSAESEAPSAPAGTPPVSSGSSNFRVRIRSTSPSKRLRRRQSDAWYVGVFDNTMVVVTDAADSATFSISNQQLRLPNSDYAFADPGDLVARGPILVGDTSTGPSTAFSIEKGTNRLLWINEEFGRRVAAFCFDDDEAVNGVYAGEIDVLCEEIQLEAESIDGSPLVIPDASASSTSLSGAGTSSIPSASLDSEVKIPTSILLEIPSSSLEPTAAVTGSPPISTTKSTEPSLQTEPPSAGAVERPGSATSSSPSSQCTAVSPSKNHIQNPGFESDTFAPWSQSSEGNNPESSISTAHPNKGGRSVLIELTTGGSSVTLSQSITTCQGRTYNGAVWLGLAITGDRASCSLFITINGLVIAEQAGTAGSYSEVPFFFTATGGTTIVGFMASCVDGVTKGTFHIDDVEVVDKPPIRHGTDITGTEGIFGDGNRDEKKEGKNQGGNENKEGGEGGEGKEGEEGEKGEDGEEENESKHPALLEFWHALQTFGDIVERVFILILGDL
ncbi:hypothetical protein TWF481_004398 [Arthrobotrys musiformis]|uniref:DUF7908 domain-containing protein n=1 Tax=Arthrobotrys musiformis TaxID=47236 RepID=A0AAV9WJG3_9PEZI